MLGAFMYLCLWAPLWVARKVWWRWNIEGLENLPPREPRTGMIIAINHLNWTDVHIIGASLPFAYRLSWIAKIELFQNQVYTWWLKQMQVIPIKRGKRDLAALAAAEEALKQGAVLLIFPEGHRSRTGGLLEGRGGAVRLSVRTGCPIVPVALWGTEHGLIGAMSRKPITMKIGEPYHPQVEGEHIPWDRMSELTEEMMLRIAALLPDQYWGFYHERMLQTS